VISIKIKGDNCHGTFCQAEYNIYFIQTNLTMRRDLVERACECFGIRAIYDRTVSPSIET